MHKGNFIELSRKLKKILPQRHKTKKMPKEDFKPLTAVEEKTGKLIVNAAYVVHKALGPGLLEKVYEVCFCHVLA